MRISNTKALQKQAEQEQRRRWDGAIWCKTFCDYKKFQIHDAENSFDAHESWTLNCKEFYMPVHVTMMKISNDETQSRHIIVLQDESEKTTLALDRDKVSN